MWPKNNKSRRGQIFGLLWKGGVCFLLHLTHKPNGVLTSRRSSKQQLPNIQINPMSSPLDGAWRQEGSRLRTGRTSIPSSWVETASICLEKLILFLVIQEGVSNLFKIVLHSVTALFTHSVIGLGLTFCSTERWHQMTNKYPILENDWEGNYVSFVFHQTLNNQSNYSWHNDLWMTSRKTHD